MDGGYLLINPPSSVEICTQPQASGDTGLEICSGVAPEAAPVWCGQRLGRLVPQTEPTRHEVGWVGSSFTEHGAEPLLNSACCFEVHGNRSPRVLLKGSSRSSPLCRYLTEGFKLPQAAAEPVVVEQVACGSALASIPLSGRAGLFR